MDARNHWASDEIDKWQGYGIANGYSDGSFRPDQAISRGEFIAMISRIFGYSVTADAILNDVPGTAWYRDNLLKAISAGIIEGDGKGNYNADRPISRQEAAVILSRVFKLEVSDKTAYTRFNDASGVAEWARDAISALTEQKYVSGRPSGKFAAQEPVTRSEALKMTDNIMGELKNASGAYSGTVKGNLVVNAEEVDLNGMIIEGNLYLTPGIGGGVISLHNVTVTGNVFINGGTSIVMHNSSVQGKVIVDQLNHSASIETDENTKLSAIQLQSGASLLLKGTVGRIDVYDSSNIVAEGGSIEQLTIHSEARDSTVQLAAGVTVLRFTANAGVSVKGQGTIETADVNANGVSFEKRPNKVNLADGVTIGGNGNGSATPGADDGTNTPPLGDTFVQSRIVFGDSADETDKNLTTKGTTGVTTIDTQVGELKDAYSVRFMEGVDSEISFELSDLTLNHPATLEIEEIHTRGDDMLAYSIFVNGVETYYRTYEELSEGPNHYFVSIDADVIGNNDEIAITFRNESGSKVNFGRVWAYGDFNELLADEQVNRPMTVGLFQPVLNWNDYASDLALIRDIKATYSNFDMYELGLGFDIFYMKWSEEELKRRLDYLMNLSKDSELPIHLSINSWWSGTPDGPDGKGGKWKDIAYNQVIYDPLNIDGRGNWKLSTPNIWSNTPWLTMNNAYYNEVRANKITMLTQYISEQTAEIQANGDSIPPVVIFTENEPLYWPYYAFNNSPTAGGDFGSDVIAAAAQDGIVLNPEDGLSDEEKLWMFNNLTPYISGVADAIAEGYGYNAIVINEGAITYPDYQLVENAYSHMFPTPGFPNWDEQRADWETHMVQNIRYGAEWAGFLDSRYLDYIVARGKYADVNAERSLVLDMETLEKAYMYGADHLTLYNYRDGDQRLIDDFDGKRNEKVTVPSHDKTILSYALAGSEPLEADAGLVSFSDVMIEGLNGKYVIAPNNGNSTGGQLTFKLNNGGEPFSSGAKIQVEGRALSEYNSSNRIEVWAGASQDALTLAATLKSFSTADVDISDYIDKTASVAYVQFKLMSPGLSSKLFSWSAIWKVKAFALSNKLSGLTNDYQFSVDEMRERNLWVGYRADVERLLQTYLSKSGADATYKAIVTQYESNKYVTAYHMLNEALSQTLPAKFAVKGNGTLGKYPITMDIENKNVVVHTVLYEYSNDVKIGFTADSAAAIRLQLDGVTGAYYKAVAKGNGIYQIRTANANEPSAIQAINGRVVFEVQSQVALPKQYPAQFEASYVSGGDGFISIQAQDPAIGEYVDAVKVRLADDVTILRGSDGAPDDELIEVPLAIVNKGEMLRITMNEANEAKLIRVYYGRATGQITAIQPISIRGQLQNAFIEIDDRYRFEIGSDAIIDSPNATGTNILTARIDDIGLKPGDEVTVVYSPYTYQGSSLRALKISEVYDTLLSETFEAEDGDWTARAYSTTNVIVESLDTNYKLKVARPENSSSPGILVWKIDSPTPLSDLAIEYSGRAIMGNPDLQSVKWFISADNVGWTQVGMIEPGSDENNFSLNRGINMDLGGQTTAYIKAEIRTSTNDTWACLNDVKIKKKAGLREVDSASISVVDDAALFAGEVAPVALQARYDNGEPVASADAKIEYLIGDESLAAIEAGKIRLLRPGTTTLQAIVSIGGKAVKSNVLTLTIRSNTLSRIEASSTKEIIGKNGTAQITVAAYNEHSDAMSPSQYEVAYTSDNAGVASVSANGTIAGVSAGAATIMVTVSKDGVDLTASIPIVVAVSRTIYQSDFANQAGCASDAVCNTYDSNDTYSVSTDSFLVQADKAVYGRVEVTANTYMNAIRGYYSGIGGPDGTWPTREAATLVYKLDSQMDEFLSLDSELLVRAGVFGSKVYVYVGDSVATANTLVQEYDQGGTKTALDLTNYAKGRKTVYVKIVIGGTAFDWGGLVEIAFHELTTE
ncbi:S-layer homology domain-containing protein [Cohnella nanjingensis]|uniref:S-layer homology domain-containing protein n=1 Tax=Cohnella nanjingensis TaxID=1387779 RepID=UPI001C8785C4|nr:S-layer homology domain-containing protein [Cohnella nanjingensis]